MPLKLGAQCNVGSIDAKGFATPAQLSNYGMQQSRKLLRSAIFSAGGGATDSKRRKD